MSGCKRYRPTVGPRIRRVVTAGKVAVECTKTSCGIEAASIIETHYIDAVGRVAVSQRIVKKCVPPYACIVSS